LLFKGPKLIFCAFVCKTVLFIRMVVKMEESKWLEL